MHDAVLLAPSNRLSMAPTPLAPYPFQTELDEQAALVASMSDEINIENLLDTDSNLSFRRDHISPQVVRKLRKGHWSVKAQLDLHGFRTDEARDCLVQFLNNCQKNDWRCVRVIHGKGLGSPDREPVLKGKVLRWLVQRDEILAFCQARPNDGGSGALIVLLKSA
jgi:DNA-nicking Smr family endonuclease